MKESASIRLVTFRRGAATFGVEVVGVRRVLRPGAIEPMSGAPAYVAGKVRVEERLEVIVDPARLLGLPDEPPPDSAPRVVLVTQESCDFGLLADDIDGVAEFPAGALQPRPPFLEDAYGVVSGLVVSDDGEILVLHLDPLLWSTPIPGPAAAD